MTLSRKVTVALLLVIVIAALVRFWRIASIPPGQHYDEAFNSLYSLRIARGEIYPVYITDNNGEEPLHIYLTALLYKIFGPTPVGGRLVSAGLGVITVGLVFFLAAELFHHLGRKEAERLGLLSSLFMATWYWPFHYNRLGMEPSTVPMVGTAAMLFIWRTVRTGSKSDAILAGAFTALGLYTYPAGRTIPLIAVIVALYHMAFGRRMTRNLIRNLALASVTAALVFLPLGVFYIQNPEWLLLRTAQTTQATLGSQSPLGALWQGLTNTLLGLFWSGDGNWRQNLPGRPMFDLMQFVFFLIGAGHCLRQVKRRPYWFLLAWSALGLLPTVLTEYSPHFGRALGAAPPLALIATLGLRAAGRQLKQWRPNLRFAPAALAGLAIAFSSGLALNDYFHRWANAPELFIAFDAGLRAIGEYAAEAPANEPIYLTPVPNEWYTLGYALGGDKDRLRSFNGRECLVFPTQAVQPTHMLIVTQPGEDERNLSRLESIFPNGRVIWTTYNHELTYALDYLIPAGETAVYRPQFPVRAVFAGSIEILGYDLNIQTLKPRQQLSLSLWWRALKTISTDYTVFIHLTDRQQYPRTGMTLWAQRDSRPCDSSYLTTRWSEGEIIWDDYRLTLPGDIPAGRYTLEIGIYNLTESQRAVVTSPVSTINDNALALTTISVEKP